MTIYEIDAKIQELLSSVDEETGEALFDLDELAGLQMEREQKVENLALAVKNYRAEAAAIKAEEEALAKRRKAVENAEKRALDYLKYISAGEGFKSARVAVSFKETKSVKVLDGFVAWAKENAPDLLRVKEPEANRVEIGKRLKAGEHFDFAEYETNTSVTIK